MVIVVTGLIAVAVFLFLIMLVRGRDPLVLPRLLKRVGFSVTAAFTGFFGLFVGGEALSDPGGLKGVGLIAAWLLPLVGLVALARYHPARATQVVSALTAVLIGASVWFAVDPEAWRSIENRNGPLRAVATFVLAAGIAVLGLKRTALSGVLLLMVGIVPTALSSLGRGGSVSLAAASVAPIVTGFLYLASAWLGRRAPPSAAADPPDELLRAA